MRISDWSSDVCSSDLVDPMNAVGVNDRPHVIAAAPAIDHCQLRHAPAHSFGSCTLGVERPVPCEEALRIDQRLGIRIETLPHQPTLELRTDRKSVEEGKDRSVGVDYGDRRIIK